MSQRRPSTELGGSPWISAASFWVPSHLVYSAWLEHGPFASWLMDALRPRTFVELGTHNGFSYFAFCQAIERLGLDTRTWALDTWAGDEHAGFYGDEIYNLVSGVNDANYSEFSTLLRGYFSDGLDSFDDGSVDLLHIDGRHTYDDVKQDFESWLPKVSDRGVVVFHDIAEHENDFGVWQLWDEISVTHPSFAFEHGHGLGVLIVGANAPESIHRFVAAGRDSADDIRADYSSLGEAIAQRYWAEADRETLRSAYYGTLQQLEELQRGEPQREHASTGGRVAGALRRAGRALPQPIRTRLAALVRRG
jgi:predicted O-methyltransferase YrrM